MSRNQNTVSENLKGGRYRVRVSPPVAAGHLTDEELQLAREVYQTELEHRRILLKNDLEMETGLRDNPYRDEAWATVAGLYWANGKLDKLVETYIKIADNLRSGGKIADGLGY